MNQISVLDESRGDVVISTDSILPQFKVYTLKDIDRIVQLQALPESVLFEMKVVSSILPFRVNQYVIENLIDWSNVPDDPLYQLTFPQKDMLPPHVYQQMAQLMQQNAPRAEIQSLASTPSPAANWR